MIGSIKGSVGYLGPDFCLIETSGGVGSVSYTHLTLPTISHV